MKRRHKQSGWDLTQHLNDEEEAGRGGEEKRRKKMNMKMNMKMRIAGNHPGTNTNMGMLSLSVAAHLTDKEEAQAIRVGLNPTPKR